MQATTTQPYPAGRRITPGHVLFAVYAPFGTDEQLTTFPDGTSHDLLQHPVVRNLRQVAASGVTVSALIDLFDGETWLVDIPAGRPEALHATSRGKSQMDEPTTLAEFLGSARARSPDAALVVAFEGHGAGFLPELDRRKLTLLDTTANGTYEWRLSSTSNLYQATGSSTGHPVVEEGAPVLPAGNPTCPSNHDVMSTWGVGAALAAGAGGDAGPAAVLHFNNCFNMSVELLHTVSPYAEYATGYCNYNFFTAGEAYPAVFARLAKAGSATSEELARWFAEENHRVLLENGHEPTVGCSVALSRMRDIVERVDDLSDALLAALRTASPSERPVTLAKIQKAIELAQQYDSRPDFVLEAPDELTDLDSLASELLQQDFGPFKVHAAADALRVALSGIKVYGDKGTPWMSPGSVWNFHAKNLAMNIFLPDPLRKGLWDWRSQYYLDVNPDPQKPAVQPHIIDFVKVTDWVDFLIEYHRDTPFMGLLPAVIPEFPVKSLRGEAPGCTHGRDGKGRPAGAR
jgi:hypothetical protein